MTSTSATAGAAIRDMRTDRGWSLRELADRCGSDLSKLSRIETGKTRITVDLLVDIADAFGVSPALLLDAEEVAERRAGTDRNALAECLTDARAALGIAISVVDVLRERT